MHEHKSKYEVSLVIPKKCMNISQNIKFPKLEIIIWMKKSMIKSY